MDLGKEIELVDLEYQIGAVRNNITGFKKDLLKLKRNRLDIEAQKEKNEKKLSELESKYEQLITEEC